MDLVKRTLVILILGLMVVHFGFRLRLITDHRVDLGAQEINVVYGIQKIMLGRPLYQDPEEPPFDVMQYTPAYYFLCAGVGSVVGIDVQDTYALFLLSRITSLLLNLTTCWLIYLLARVIGAGTWLGLATGALVFALHSEQFYSRVDSLYALFFTASLLVFIRSIHAEGRKGLLVCTLLCALAFMTKQNGVLMIGIVGAYLLIERSWRSFGLFAIASMLFILAGLGLTLIDSAPIDLWKNTVQGLMNGLVERPFPHFRDPGVYKFYAGWHIAAVALFVVFFRKGNGVFRFFAVAILLSLLFGAVASFKQGSGSHYLFEFHLFVMVGCVVWIASASERASRVAGVLFLSYALLFMVHRTRQLQVWLGSDAERSTSLEEYRSDLRAFHVLVGELGLRTQDRVFITYRGHLELLLNGYGLLAQKDILEWSRTPPFDLHLFDQAMVDGTVRYVISNTATDPMRSMGYNDPLFRPVREWEGRIIWSRAPTVSGTPTGL